MLDKTTTFVVSFPYKSHNLNTKFYIRAPKLRTPLKNSAGTRPLKAANIHCTHIHTHPVRRTRHLAHRDLKKRRNILDKITTLVFVFSHKNHNLNTQFYIRAHKLKTPLKNLAGMRSLKAAKYTLYTHTHPVRCTRHNATTV